MLLSQVLSGGGQGSARGPARPLAALLAPFDLCFPSWFSFLNEIIVVEIGFSREVAAHVTLKGAMLLCPTWSVPVLGPSFSLDKPFHKHALLHAECAVYAFWRARGPVGSRDRQRPNLALLVLKGPAATLSLLTPSGVSTGCR